MDPPSADRSRRRAPGTGGKSRGGKQLGLKRTSAHAPSLWPPVPPSPPPLTPAAPTPGAPTSSPGAPTSSPPPPVSTVPPQPLQEAGWGAMPPNFASLHGNQQFPNSWGYPPGGFVNFMQQSYPPQAHVQGENFHLVGQRMAFNPISPPPPNAHGASTPRGTKEGTSTDKTVNLDEDDNADGNRAGKKRFWSPEEEERLASAWLNASKDPVKGNDKRGDTFWKEVTDEFNKKGDGKPRRETNQLKIHWSRLKSAITDFKISLI